MEPIKLPTLGYFKNGNGFLGSLGLLRYELENHIPKKEEQVEGQVYELTAVLWQGPFSRPYAQEVGRESFPIDEAGLDALKAFLVAKSQEMTQSPPFTSAETTAYYHAKKAEEHAPKAE